MKKNTRIILLIVGLSLIGFGLYKWKSDQTPVETPETVETAEGQNQEDFVEKPLDSAEGSEQTAATPPPSKEPPNPALIQQKFAEGLKKLGTCFNLRGDVPERVEPTYQNLNGFVRADMGDAISMSDIWTDTDIQTSSGEIRRIRIDMDYDGDQNVSRRLKYYTIDANDDVTMIPLSAEQAENASDTFIATLESDGKVISRSRSVTAYYPNFAEMSFTEKDGHLVNMEVLMGESGKFTCANMDNNNISCQCHNQ